MHAMTKYDFYFLKGEKAAFQEAPVKKNCFKRLFNKYEFPKRVQQCKSIDWSKKTSLVENVGVFLKKEFLGFFNREK